MQEQVEEPPEVQRVAVRETSQTVVTSTTTTTTTTTSAPTTTTTPATTSTTTTSLPPVEHGLEYVDQLQLAHQGRAEVEVLRQVQHAPHRYAPGRALCSCKIDTVTFPIPVAIYCAECWSRSRST